jgi:RNA polymerase sigma-70 factor (ECF subfamily)
VAGRESNPEQEITRAFTERRRTLRAVAKRAANQDEEDVVQDAFLRVIEISRREQIDKVDNLLSRVVRCFAIDRFRRRATRSALMGAELGEGPVDAAADPERTLMSAQRLKRVLAAIDAMPPRRREVFLLHRVDEMTYAQIARRLEISIKAVEKHMHLAMRQLSDTDD